MYIHVLLRRNLSSLLWVVYLPTFLRSVHNRLCFCLLYLSRFRRGSPDRQQHHIYTYKIWSPTPLQSLWWICAFDSVHVHVKRTWLKVARLNYSVPYDVTVKSMCFVLVLIIFNSTLNILFWCGCLILQAKKILWGDPRSLNMISVSER
jgi:hypothetical protein